MFQKITGSRNRGGIGEKKVNDSSRVSQVRNTYNKNFDVSIAVERTICNGRGTKFVREDPGRN